MALFERRSLTAAGRALIAKAQAGRTSIQFTKAQSGAGLWANTEDITTATALKTVKQTFTFSGITIPEGNPSTVVLKVVMSNEGLTELYYVTEMGIFAQDPDDGEILYAIQVSSRQIEYLPAENGIGVSAITERINLEVCDAPNVTVNMAGAYASADDFDSLQTLVQAIEEGLRGGTLGQILRKTGANNYQYAWDDEKVEVLTDERVNFPSTGHKDALYVDTDSSSIYIWLNGAYFKLPLGAEAAETLQQQITALQKKFATQDFTVAAASWTATTENGVTVYTQSLTYAAMTAATSARVWTKLISNHADDILLEQKAQSIFTARGRAYSQDGSVLLKCYGKCPAHDFGITVEGI